jgi:MFS family permease
MAAGRRIFLAYLIFYGATGASFPYLPVFYHDLRLSLQEIGVLTAIQAGIALVLAPIWGGLADRFSRTRLTLPLAGLVAVAGGIDLFVATDFPTVLAGSVLLYAGLAGLGPMLDARTLETLGPEGRAGFGQVRAVGSFSYVLSTLAVGVLLGLQGSRALFWVYLPALLATVVVTTTLRRHGTNRPISLFRGAINILAAPGMLLLFAGFTVVWTALAALSAFYSIQIVALGGNTSMVGAGWAIGAAIEVPLMFIFPRLSARFGTERLVVFGATAFTLRAFVAALATGPLGLVLVAPLEGVAFACFFVGAVTVLSVRIPPSLVGTGQGLFSASTGLATIIGSVGGGAIAGALSIPTLFAACGLLGLVGAGIIALAVLGPGGDRMRAAEALGPHIRAR